MSHRIEKKINAWVATTRYPGFRHKSFNLRFGRNHMIGGDTKEAYELQKKLLAEYREAHPDWQQSFDDPGPTAIPSYGYTPRNLTLSLHVRYGKQLVAIRPEIELRRKSIWDIRDTHLPKRIGAR